MSRTSRSDPKLDQLNDEREQAAIEVSLASDANPPDLVRIADLTRKLEWLDALIYRHKPELRIGD